MQLHRDESELLVFTELLPGVQVVCPDCGAAARRYDHRERGWLRLDQLEDGSVAAT